MTTQRPLTSKEFKAINKLIHLSEKNKIFQIKFLTGWTFVSILIGILIFIFSRKPPLNLLFLTVIIYIAIGAWDYLKIFLRSKENRKSIEFALKKNVLTSIKVVSTDYYQLLEIEDEGIFYLFQLPDNKILSFGGQNFYPTKKFPNTEFEIAVCYGIKSEILFLKVYNYGNKLLPKLKIIGQKKMDWLGNINYPNPDNFTIIDGQLENFETQVLGLKK